MKKIILYSALSLTLAAVGCQDEYEAPDSLYDVAWCVNQTAASLMERNQGDYMSFLDMSVNASSHTWGIEEGNYFLNGGFGDGDSLALFINEEMGLETTDVQVNVLLNNPGTNYIRLYNTFDEKVSWNGSVPLTSVYDADIDKWVIDTLLEVYVFETMQPAAEIYKETTVVDATTGEEVLEYTKVCTVEAGVEYSLKDSLSWPEVELMAGERLQAIDMTTIGEPSSRTWSFRGSNTSSSGDSIAYAPYYSLGSYVGLSLTAVRSTPSPEASVSTNIPLRVKVIQSTIAFSASGDATEQEDETLLLGVTGELETLPLTAASDFTVYATNTTSGFSGEIAIKSIKVYSSDATKLVITLDEPIYNSDEITITYNGASSAENEIASVDERILQPFSDVETEMFYTASVLGGSASLDFETAGSEAMYPADGWWTPAPESWYYSTDMFASGNASVCVSGTDLTDTRMQATVTIPDAGTYLLRCAIFIDASKNSGLTALNTIFTGPWIDNAFDLSSVERGKWVTVEAPTFTFSEGMSTDMWVRIYSAPGDVLFYIDDFELILLETRP